MPDPHSKANDGTLPHLYIVNVIASELCRKRTPAFPKNHPVHTAAEDICGLHPYGTVRDEERAKQHTHGEE
jgi:hypothetical protein